VNSALLLATVWLAAADPAPAAPPAPAIVSAPACTGGSCGGGYCGGGHCGSTCCDSCYDPCCDPCCKPSLFDRLFSRFRKNDCCCDPCCEPCCNTCAPTCCAPTCCAPAKTCCTSSCGSCCNTCCDPCCDPCCEKKGGFFSGLFGRFRKNDCCCDPCCDPCGGYSGHYGAPAAPPAGTMPKAGEPIPPPKDGGDPGKKMPPGGDNPAPVGAAPRSVTPPSLEIAPKTDDVEVKSPFELSRRYEAPVQRAPDYSWLTGQLYFVHADGGLWLLRYAPLSEEDPNGGSVILARGLPMDSYREGDLVLVEGEIINQKRSSIFLGAPQYRARSIELIDRPNN
jgi:hypothetical protein